MLFPHVIGLALERPHELVEVDGAVAVDVELGEDLVRVGHCDLDVEAVPQDQDELVLGDLILAVLEFLLAVQCKMVKTNASQETFEDSFKQVIIIVSY